MTNNEQSNVIVKWIIILGDFFILNALILAFLRLHPQMVQWATSSKQVFVLASNLAMVISESQFYTLIYRRIVNSAEILRRIVLLTMTQTVLAYLFVKLLQYYLPIVKVLLLMGTMMFIVILLSRFIEHRLIRLYRKSGRNMRSVVLVGNDKELLSICKRLMRDAARGYRILGYYSDEEMDDAKNGLKWLGTIDELLAKKHNQEMQEKIDDMYVSSVEAKS